MMPLNSTPTVAYAVGAGIGALLYVSSFLIPRIFRSTTDDLEKQAKDKERNKAKQWRELTARAKAMERRFAEHMISGESWSDDLSFAWQDFMERLRSYDILPPDFINNDPDCMLYLRAYLTSLLVALEEEDLERARKVVYHCSLPQNMIPGQEENRDHSLDSTESKLRRSSNLPDLDRKILMQIADLEKEDRAITARSVWGLLPDSVEKICERLVLLERTDYISAQIGPKKYVGGTTSTVRDGDIHGLTEKGRAAITRRVQG